MSDHLGQLCSTARRGCAVSCESRVAQFFDGAAEEVEEHEDAVGGFGGFEALLQAVGGFGCWF